MRLFVLMMLICSSVNAAQLCEFGGHKLYGKVKVVHSFADFKVRKTTSFPDVTVREVKNFADSCGEWQFVDSFPDFTIQFVESFEDFSVDIK